MGSYRDADKCGAVCWEYGAWWGRALLPALLSAGIATGVVAADRSPGVISFSVRYDWVMWAATGAAILGMLVVRGDSITRQAQHRRVHLAELHAACQELYNLVYDLHASTSTAAETLNHTRKCLHELVCCCMRAESVRYELLDALVDAEWDHIKPRRDHARGGYGVLLNVLERRLLAQCRGNSAVRLIFMSIRKNATVLAAAHPSRETAGVFPNRMVLGLFTVLWAGSLASPLLHLNTLSLGWVIGLCALTGWLWGVLLEQDGLGASLEAGQEALAYTSLVKPVDRTLHKLPADEHARTGGRNGGNNGRGPCWAGDAPVAIDPYDAPVELIGSFSMDGGAVMFGGGHAAGPSRASGAGDGAGGKTAMRQRVTFLSASAGEERQVPAQPATYKSMGAVPTPPRHAAPAHAAAPTAPDTLLGVVTHTPQASPTAPDLLSGVKAPPTPPDAALASGRLVPTGAVSGAAWLLPAPSTTTPHDIPNAAAAPTHPQPHPGGEPVAPITSNTGSSAFAPPETLRGVPMAVNTDANATVDTSQPREQSVGDLVRAAAAAPAAAMEPQPQPLSSHSPSPEARRVRGSTRARVGAGRAPPPQQQPPYAATLSPSVDREASSERDAAGYLPEASPDARVAAAAGSVTATATATATASASPSNAAAVPAVGTPVGVIADSADADDTPEEAVRTAVPTAQSTREARARSSELRLVRHRVPTDELPMRHHGGGEHYDPSVLVYSPSNPNDNSTGGAGGTGDPRTTSPPRRTARLPTSSAAASPAGTPPQTAAAADNREWFNSSTGSAYAHDPAAVAAAQDAYETSTLGVPSVGLLLGRGAGEGEFARYAGAWSAPDHPEFSFAISKSGAFAADQEQGALAYGPRWQAKGVANPLSHEKTVVVALADTWLAFSDLRVEERVLSAGEVVRYVDTLRSEGLRSAVLARMNELAGARPPVKFRVGRKTMDVEISDAENSVMIRAEGEVVDVVVGETAAGTGNAATPASPPRAPQQAHTYIDMDHAAGGSPVRASRVSLIHNRGTGGGSPGAPHEPIGLVATGGAYHTPLQSEADRDKPLFEWFEAPVESPEHADDDLVLRPDYL